MRFQEHAIGETRYAMGEAFRYARAVPEEKVDWSPLEQGQSVLGMCRELAKCADWAVEVLETGRMNLDPDEASVAEMQSLTTVAECEAMAHAKLERFYAVAAEYPDDRLEGTIELPFGADGAMRTFTMREMMDYPRWNAVYHQGQIAYIQTLYGDLGLH